MSPGSHIALASCVSVTFLLASGFLAARLVSRFGIVGYRGWDDHTLIAAWILALGLSFVVCFSILTGLWVDGTEIVGGTRSLTLVYAALVLFNPAQMAVKISILLLYIHIAKRTQEFLRIGSYLTLVSVIVGGITLTFLTAFRCRPIHAAYNIAVEEPKCLSIRNILLSATPVNIATDLAILVLPITVLTTLRVSRLRIAAIVLSFILGAILVVVVDTLRIHYLQLAAIEAKNHPNGPVSTQMGSTHQGVISLALSAIEINVFIIGASIPTLLPLLRRIPFVHDLSSSIQGRSSSTRSDRGLFMRVLPLSWYPRSTTDAPPTQSNTESLPPTNWTLPNLSPPPFPTFPPQALVSPQVSPIPHIQRYSAASLGFVSLPQRNCLVDMRGLESLKYCSAVNALMFLCGFTSSMIYFVNAQLPVAIDREGSRFLTTASDCGTGLLGPTLAYLILRRGGYKPTLLTSLAILCAGTLMFWPSGAVGSYPAFIISSVAVGASLGCLRTASDAFNALCGSRDYAVIRVLLGYAWQEAGSTLSRSIAASAINTKNRQPGNLISLQWSYFSIALLTVLLGLLFYYIPLPEMSDSDLRDHQDLLWISPSRRRLRTIPILFIPLVLGMWSTFCISGAESSLREFITDLLASRGIGGRPGLEFRHFQSALLGIQTTGLFLYAILCLIMPPSLIFILSISLSIARTVLGGTLPSPGNIQTISLAFAMFPGTMPQLCMSMAMYGLGPWTTLASCLLVSCASIGSSAWQWVTAAVADSDWSHESHIVAFSLLAASTVFPLYLIMDPAARRLGPPRRWCCRE